MNCPRCKNILIMSDKHGVEIDFCPICQGVWLDRGELEKIIEREFSMRSKNNQYDEDDDVDDDDLYKNQKNIDSQYNKRRKKSFWSDLLDF